MSGSILNRLFRSLSESSWLCGLENRSVSLVTGSWHCSNYWELSIICSEQVRPGSSDVVLVVQYCCSDD